MKLQTEIPIHPERNPIDYASKVVLLGSCFSENVGAKFLYYQFQHLVNPFGILFHPFAIEQLITRAINETVFTEKDLVFHNEQWHCFEVHSSLSASNKEELLRKLNNILKQFQKEIETATHFIFTYGTAWVYRFIETDRYVANCHKIPQKQFLKELASVEEIAASIDNTITLIKSSNPNVVCIHTVSPVRHVKDGMVENTRSKAHLIAGIHEVISPRDRVHYFPSYEVMMDELRDYRFYTEDLVHPSNTAIQIVWEKFAEAWVSSEAKHFQKDIETIQNGLSHRPFHPESKAHQEFQKNLQKKIETLQKQLPYTNFEGTSFS